MSKYSSPEIINNLADHLSSLPGIGPKMATKLAVYLATKGKSVAEILTVDLERLAQILECEKCGNLSEAILCKVCADSTRDASVVMVIESVTDLLQVENSGEFEGVYVVLGGLVSPLSGTSPADLNLDLLSNRIRNEKVTEVILALSSTVEGEATSLYLQQNILVDKDIKISQLARGLPSGVNVEYLDSQTIKGALGGRVAI